MHSNVVHALGQLRSSTARLTSLSSGHLDVSALEEAIGNREIAVGYVGRLVAESPESFVPEDLEALRACLAAGKSAYEQFVTSRGCGWTVATELSKNQYVLRTISQFGAAPGRMPGD